MLLATKLKEVERVRANNKKQQAELKEKAVAVVNNINAETNVM